MADLGAMELESDERPAELTASFLDDARTLVAGALFTAAALVVGTVLVTVALTLGVVGSPVLALVVAYALIRQLKPRRSARTAS